MSKKIKRRGKVKTARKPGTSRPRSAKKAAAGTGTKQRDLSARDDIFRSAIIKRAFDGICVCHNIPEHPFVRFTVWNDRMTKLTGYTMAQINKLGWHQTMYPDPELREKAVARMAAMREGDDIISEEWAIIRKDSQKRTVSISTSVLFSDQGQTHVLAFMRDVTDQERADDALRYKAEFESLLTSISSRFINLRSDEIPQEMERALAEIAYFTGVERTHVMTINPEFSEFSCIAEYAAAGLDRYGHFFQNVPISIIPDWFKKIKSQEVLYVPDFKKEFHPGPKLKEVFATLEIMSVIEVPIISSGNLIGILGLVSKDERQWPEDQISLLRVVAEIFGNAVERRKMEIALRESEGRFRGLFDNAPIPIMEDDYSAVKGYADQLKAEQGVNVEQYLRDHQEAVLECMKRIKTLNMNQAAKKMFGVKDVRELMKALPGLMNPRTFEDFKKGVRAMVAGKTRLDVETQLKTASGAMRDVIVRWSVPPGYEQSYARVLVLILDITESKSATQALRESEERYRTLFESAPVSITILDLDLKVLDSNGYFGSPREKMIGSNFLEFFQVPEKERKFIHAINQRLLAGEKIGPIEKTFSLQGRQRWLEFHISVLRRDGKPWGYQAIVSDISERKLAEQALRESEEKYRLLVNNIPSVTWISTRDGKTSFISSNVEKIYGFSAEQIITGGSKVWFDRIHPDDRDRVLAAIYLLFDQNQEFNVEYRVRHQNGDWIWIQDRAFQVYEKNGEKFAFGIFSDITERKMAEEALKQSELKYRDIIRTTSDGFWNVDSEARFLDVNDAACSMLGYTRDELLKMRVADVEESEKPEEVNQHLQKMREKGGDRFETLHRRKDGTKIDVEVITSFITEAQGLERIIVFARDISERKLAEQALRESEEKYRTLFDSAPISISIIGLDGTVQAANKYLQIPQETIIGKNYRDLKILPLEYHKHLNELFVKLLKEEQIGPVELKMTLADDRELWLESYGSLLKKDGLPYAVQVIARDITEHKKLQEQFLQAQKMEAIGRLAGGVAHDFNNQLMVIMTVIEMLEMSMDQGDQRLEKIDMIKKAAEQSASLTRQLLAFSRKQVIEPVVLNLNDVLNNLQKMLARMIGEDISLEIIPDPKAGLVKVDPVQVEQVIINLAVNARDAMPKGGVLTIETANVFLDEEYVKTHPVVSPGPFVMLAMTDTGVGMDKDTQKKIFEPFFTTKELGKGTGLGLATVYGIVKQFGGDIYIYSERDKGTTFKVYLPRVEGEAAGHGARKKIAPEMTGGTETIFVIEDENVVRETMVIILKDRGYHVLEASGGRQALKAIREHQGALDLVITDVVMPGLSGKEFARQLHEFKPDIKILYVSGYTDNVIAHHGILDPEINFLQKPFTIESLLTKVREIMDKPVK